MILTLDSNPNYNMRPDVPSRVNGIVVHTAGQYIDSTPAAEFMKLHGYSYHNIVTSDGKVLRCVDWDNRAWHAGKSRLGEQSNLNDTFLGFCMLVPGDFSAGTWDQFVATMNNPDAYTSEHYDRMAELCAQAMARYPDIRFNRIVGHSEVSGPDVRDDPKKDPGEGFNMNRLKELIIEKR